MSFYYPTESDRAWLTEAFVGQDHFTPDDAIVVPDETQLVFRVSVIDNQQRCWFMHDINTVSRTALTVGMVTHPGIRGRGVGTALFRQHSRWLRDQPWGLLYYISTVPGNAGGTPAASYGPHWEKLGYTINIHTRPGEEPNPAYDYDAYQTLLSNV